MMKPTFLRWVALAALMAGGTFSVAANPPAAPPVSYGVEEDVFHPVRATHGMVASVDALATRVGADILRQGGNAVDAAVAVGYALAVTHPQAGNLGGGGFMMLRTKDGKTTAIDFREMAPSQASRDMFLDDQGNPDSKKSLTSHLASGTPGPESVTIAATAGPPPASWDAPPDTASTPPAGIASSAFSRRFRNTCSISLAEQRTGGNCGS